MTATANQDSQPQSSSWSLIVLFMAAIAFIAWMMISTALDIKHKRSDATALHEAGKRSLVHQFVVDKFMACNGDSATPSDACLLQTLQLAQVLHGPEFAAKATAVAHDLGLDK